MKNSLKVNIRLGLFIIACATAIIATGLMSYDMIDSRSKILKLQQDASKISKYEAKGDIKSLTIVPIHDNRYDNVKPHEVSVYTQDVDDELQNISELGQFTTSDKHHQFGTWKPKVSQKII